MNCKKGELAFIVGPSTTPNLGRVVRCIRLLAHGEEMMRDGFVFVATSHGEFWEVEGRLEGEDEFGRDVTVMFGPVGDRWLRPIRDPGEDAIDEMVQRLPAPSAETAAA